jgi:hypothetical protein
MDDAKNTYKVPTPQDSLESQIMDPNFPKNEREWWASEEITRLRAEVEALKAENAALASWQCLFTDGTTGLYHDGCGNAQCARDHLVVHLTAEVEALRADAERWRYINERNGEWRRFEADGPDPAYSMLCVRLPYDADLSCRATREIAIDAARAAQGEKS